MYSLYTFVMSRFYDPRLKGLASHERAVKKENIYKKRKSGQAFPQCSQYFEVTPR